MAHALQSIGLTALVFALMFLAAAPADAARHKGSPNLEPGLRGRSDIVFFCDFESENWWREWGERRKAQYGDTVAEDEANKFVPFQGKALRIKVAQGGHMGISLQFRFKKQIGEEPEEIYFRYYLRLGDDWDPAKGGKFPGIAGTYGRAGWGGRFTDGKNGWSARGLFSGQKGNKTPIGFYCYHPGRGAKWGEHWEWKKSGLGRIPNNQWRCIEQYVKLNTPATDGGQGKKDGILRGWVNGKLAFEKTDIRFRDVDTLKIETIWVNLYQGGFWTAKTDHHLYMDNVVVARNYIGPMQREVAKKKPKRRKFVFKSKAEQKPDPLAAYTEQLKPVRAMEKAGDFAGAATEVRRLAETGVSDDARSVLAFAAQALDGAAMLRRRVIKTVQGGKRVSVYLNMGIGKTRARTVGADDNAIVIEARGARVPVPWRTLTAVDFIGVATKVLADGPASDQLALARYCLYVGLKERGREALDRATSLDASLRAEVAQIREHAKN